MQRDEAQAEAAGRNAAGPRGGLWAARRVEGEDDAWQVVRLVAPGLKDSAPTGAHVESRPRPEADDPRSGPLRDIPPYGAF
jgi:hypothetical protein